MDCEKLESSLNKYRELKSVNNTLDSIDDGQIDVKVEYKDKQKGCSTDERCNYFKPSASDFKVFLESYRDRLVSELKNAGLKVPEELTSK